MVAPDPRSAGRVVGILALQGDFPSHEAMLAGRGLRTRRVRRPAQLDGLSAIVLPGGESSVMWKLACAEGLVDSLRAAVTTGLPVLATCAGLILLAREVRRPAQPSLGVLDVVVERNGYGRQVHSAVHRLAGHGGFPDSEGVFIRAPRIVSVGTGVETVATWGGDPVLVRSGQVLGTCFHPELGTGHPVLDLFVGQLVRDQEEHAPRAG